MRLLLDEQYSPEIAQRLRAKGYDVEAVKGNAALEGMGDDPLLRSATGQSRALLTNNARDFAPLVREWAAGGEEHYGLIFTSDEGMPRSRDTIGLYVERLAELLDARTGDEAFASRVEWLSAQQNS